MRVWFNRTFSSVYTAIRLIREGDTTKEIHTIYSNANPHAAAGQVAHQFNVEPTGMSDSDYVQWCFEFCKEHRVDVFWPGRAAGLLSTEHRRFADHGVGIMSVATKEVLDLLHDKSRFYATVDLPEAPPAKVIEFRNLAEFDEAYALIRPLHEKLCIKPSSSVYGLGFSVLDESRNAAELLMQGEQYHIGLNDFRLGLKEEGECRSMLLMEYLDGQEYSVDCIAGYGELKCAIPRRKPLKNGLGQVIDMRPDVLEATAKLAKMYQLNGVFNVQFREGSGKLRVLEINPRMSGGMGMACIAGPKLPYLALMGYVHGYEKVEIPPVRADIRVGEVSCPIELL